MSNVNQPGPSHSTVQNDSPSLLSWEGDKMFNIYIYDYCFKRGFRKTAQELLHEADIPPDSQPPINARQGLLFEWWSVFWVLFTAKANGTGSEDALTYIQASFEYNGFSRFYPLHGNQANARARLPGPGGQPLPGGRQVGNGGMPMGPRPFPPTNGPMMNGVGPNPGPGFSNGLLLPPNQSAPPNQSGPNFAPLPGQRQSLTGNPRGSSGGAGPFPSPIMANSPHNNGSGPHSSQQQPPMMSTLGHSPHLGPRIMPPPPNGMQGAPGPYPNLNRPPSRTTSPGQMVGMIQHRSPSLGARQAPGMDPIGGIPLPNLNSLKEEVGLAGKENANLTMEEKSRLVNLWRNRQQRKPGGPPNVTAPGPSMPMPPPGSRRTAGKRSSTSPREDQPDIAATGSPPNKKPRHSPDAMAYQQGPGAQPGMGPPGGPGQPPMPGQQPMGGMRPPMAGGPMNGFQPGPGSMGGPMGGPPPPMGPNGIPPHMNAMSPSMGGMPGQPSGMMTPQMQVMSRQQDGSMIYRSQVANYTRTQMQGSGAGSPSDPTFGVGPGGPSTNPFPGAPGSQGRMPGKHGSGLIPPPSPRMNKDGSKDGGMGMKIEDSPRNGMNPPPSAGMTPTGTGPSSSTPGPSGNSLSGLPPSSQNQTPTNSQSGPPPPPPSTMDSLGVGNPQMGGMMPNGAGMSDIPFLDGFMTDLDFDPNIFRDTTVGVGVGGDLNFERDFGQWFNPNDQALEDPLDPLK
ncbi:hypothetical protein D9757_006677 [Collybiopsis confluens]|uniref:LisH domain-containing protein n=1 Tax=Collybiopsis confluens TaxID=2823264 RepID=A0A8H5HN50_9AGAR|nr:hypothetical protein D9757_006677 [Collybiopsis confluens]